ncbi:MAG TPA: hypothetical protein VFD92_04880 [Candidatus Binatia bacterium]|nr:hypothetical protein [Candidatus Binatia bacterium]
MSLPADVCALAQRRWPKAVVWDDGERLLVFASPFIRTPALDVGGPTADARAAAALEALETWLPAWDLAVAEAEVTPCQQQMNSTP